MHFLDGNMNSTLNPDLDSHWYTQELKEGRNNSKIGSHLQRCQMYGGNSTYRQGPSQAHHESTEFHSWSYAHSQQSTLKPASNHGLNKVTIDALCPLYRPWANEWATASGKCQLALHHPPPCKHNQAYWGTPSSQNATFTATWIPGHRPHESVPNVAESIAKDCPGLLTLVPVLQLRSKISPHTHFWRCQARNIWIQQTMLTVKRNKANPFDCHFSLYKTPSIMLFKQTSSHSKSTIVDCIEQAYGSLADDPKFLQALWLLAVAVLLRWQRNRNPTTTGQDALRCRHYHNSSNRSTRYLNRPAGSHWGSTHCHHGSTNSQSTRPGRSTRGKHQSERTCVGKDHRQSNERNPLYSSQPFHIFY